MQRQLEHAEGLVAARLAAVHRRPKGLHVVTTGADDELANAASLVDRAVRARGRTVRSYACVRSTPHHARGIESVHSVVSA